jgi:hypothetical protein
MDDVPKWPDFSLHREDWGGGRGFWMARTDTGRPGQPIFNLMVRTTDHLRREAMTEDEVRVLARAELDRRYARAHPHGCGERKADDSNASRLSDQTG